MKYRLLSKYILVSVAFIVISCSPKTSVVQNQPPNFLGRIVDNTVSRYNALYNSELIYDTSINAAEKGYQEEYDSLFSPSVQDAIARDGSVGGQMDEIINKTTALIEAKPYSKWVDDHFLLNGVAHYIKGDYDMAEQIFRYVGSEYQAGVQYDRVTSRQKVKDAERAEQLRDEAKERLKEAEERIEEREEEIKEEEKDRRLTAKERAKEAKRLKKRNQRLKKEAEDEFDSRREQGEDAVALEIVKEIKERENEVQEKRSKISDKDKEIIAKAPTLKFDENFQKEGLLAHELAAKDALLWLAKTYITTEQFLSAQAILTVINEDPYFPERLNTEYYLTYADMHIRLENVDKAIEYVQLAAEASSRRGKGRLYFLLGQLYAQKDDWTNAAEAFNTVEKYHPYYDMIYHAKMNVIDRAHVEGRFENEDFITPLKKMTRDAKNDDFLDEVFYYLGEAYTAKGQPEKAIESFQAAIDYEGGKDEKSVKNSYVALANQYFMDKDFPNAQDNFEQALALIDESSTEHATIGVYAESTTIINENIAIIEEADSLLNFSKLSPEDQIDFIEKKVKKEVRDEFRDKLKSANDEFGNQNKTNTNRKRNTRNNPDAANSAFYFYDIQQSTLGFNEFKQEWGARPNVDNWRRGSEIENKRKRARGRQAEQLKDVEISSEEQRIATYLAEVPNSPAQKEELNTQIIQAYQNLIAVFGQKVGDEELHGYYTEELKKRNPSQEILTSLNETNSQSLGISNQDNVSEKQPSEYEKLYELAYESYVAGKFEKAIQYGEQASSFQEKSLNDKFAFVAAMSRGMLADKETLKTELTNFTEEFPLSPLKERALMIINQ